MNAKQLERASYMAAHAILSSNTSAPHLATPGARRTYTIDVIAERIRSVFELHCSALDESTDWWAAPAPLRRPDAARKELSEITPQANSNSKKLQLIMQELQ